MRDLAILFLHLITTVSRLFGPGGAHVLLRSHCAKLAHRPTPKSPVQWLTQLASFREFSLASLTPNPV